MPGMKGKRVLISGAGGFIGVHLVRYLKSLGCWVRGVDLKRPRWSRSEVDEFLLVDLRERAGATRATAGVDWVFALAATMGGVGFITQKQASAEIARDNTLIDSSTLRTSHLNDVERLLFVSSVCVYPGHKLSDLDPVPLHEDDVYPARPRTLYGWSKLHSEHLCRAYREAEWLDTRVVRLQSTYGPECEWEDSGKAKVVGDLCRKVAIAKLSGKHQVEVWGDGKQTRSPMFVGDCVKGLVASMKSDCPGPVTLGPDRTISVNELLAIILDAAAIDLEVVHVEGPQGERGRRFDHSLALERLDWQPQVSLEDGLSQTYRWVEARVEEQLGY